MKEGSTMDTSKHYLSEHLNELRLRLIYIVVMFVLSTLVGFTFASDMIYYFKESALEQQNILLNVFSPMSAIMLYMKVTFVFALIIMFPFIFYQFWRFLSPGLNRKERKATMYYIPFSGLLFIVGLLFGYTIVFPLLFDFVLSFAEKLGFQQVIGAEEYFRTLFNLVVPLALFFELPIIVLFLTQLRILTPKRLSRYRKIAYLVLIITAGLLTPPDIISQIVISVPLIALFEISILLSSLIYRRQLRQDKEFMNEGKDDSGSRSDDEVQQDDKN